MASDPEGPVEDWTLEELETVAKVSPGRMRDRAVEELVRRADPAHQEGDEA